jgi:hypothetical protein
MIPTSRKLENIVPKEHRKTFSLYSEADDTQFNLSASPKKDAGNEGIPAEQEPMAASPVPEPVEDKGTKDQSTWLVKKLVGLLRYAGAMAIEVRGAVPDEAFEIIDKLQDELENIAASLEPFVSSKPQEEIETEQPVEEEPSQETEEQPVETAEPAAPKITDKQKFRLR